jgi:isopenicillin-N N-acyltransferase-like protein
MRIFSYPPEASWRERGRAHGEAFAGEIRSLAELRIYLTRQVGGFDSEAAVLGLAERHLPVLESFDRDLHDELVGIAEGADATPAEIAVLNHYTDLRDLGRGGGGVAGADGCTALWARTPSGPVIAQTWDMHISAMPYVIMIQVPATERAPAAWLLSLTGCLGMAGIASSGVAVAINNLHSTDAGIGVLWPALVRRALAGADAAAARDLILAAPIGSGHHYLVGDAAAVYGIETSGQLREVVFAGERDLYVHTNHCLLESVGGRSRVPAGSTTYERLERASKDAVAQPIASVEDAFLRLGSEDGWPASVCTNMSSPERPHGAATCAGVAFDMEQRLALACAGFPHNAEPDVFRIGARSV